MRAKPKSPPRIPKGSKEGGQFMPKWAAEMQEKVCELDFAINGRESANPHDGPYMVGLIDKVDDLSSRLGTSTPLITWNIAVLIAIAGLGVAVARLYGIAP